MPQSYGTGPYGKGGKRGRGKGRGSGKNRDFGQGRGRSRKHFGLGPEGFCVCPECKTRIEHQTGIPCIKTKCPECGHLMVREEIIEKSEGKK